jgi:HEAT repeat protein
MMSDILKQLASKQSGVRWKAVQSIFRQPNLAFSAELIHILIGLLGDSHPGVRTYARKSLQIAGTNILPYLRNALQIPCNPHQLMQIAWLAGNLDANLLLSLTADKRLTVKIAVLQAMARRPNRRYQSYQLLSLRDPNGHVRYHAALGLARQGLTYAPDALIDALKSDSVLARGAAMYALGKIGDRNTVEALKEALVSAIEDASLEPSITATAGQPMTQEQWRRFSAAHGPLDLPLMAIRALIWIGAPGLAAIRSLEASRISKVRACVEFATVAMSKG